MKKQLLMGAMLLSCAQLFAQTQSLGKPLSWNGKVPMSKKTIEMPVVDNVAEQAAEANRRAYSYEKNLRFGVEQAVNINFMQEATVQTLPNGDVLRQLNIHSANAVSINLIFSQFELATGTRLYLFDKNQTEFIGAHTSLNNNANKMLGTELIHSDRVVIELVEPAAVAGASTLVIGTVVHGYLDLERELKALNDSGDCEYDVNCPIGAGWENQRNSVAMMVNGGGFCTGSLLNNTSGTIIPYFLSANHCGTSPGGWVFRFRWESPAAQADCATSANSVNGPTNMNVNGGVLRANNADSDFTLTELNSDPDPAWGIYYNGWDRSGTVPQSGTGVHHPAGDIKKISFEYQPLVSTTFGSCPPNSHWGVTTWDEGVTEGGSSGSPIYDQNHRTVGQLHGGASVCNGSQLSDEYGKVSVSWVGAGTNSTRLSNWLDPGNTGAMTVDGVDPAGPGLAEDAGVGNLQGVSGTFCSGTVTPKFTLTNNGSDALTSATIMYGFDGALTQTYNWTGNLAQYAFQVITLPASTLSGGSHTFGANVTSVNGGGVDENTGNNAATSSFTTVVGGEVANLTLTLDCFGTETTWEFRNNTTNELLFSGGPYNDNASGGEVITQQFCVNPACYKFIIEDSFGDGLSSDPGFGCTMSGSYTITNSNGDEVAGLSTAESGFGTSNTQVMCLGVVGLEELHALQQMWSVYPNPTDNVLNIEMSAIQGQKTIVVTNTTGQLVSRIDSVEGQATVGVAGLAKGVYFVNLSSATGSTTKTFVVK